jgi:hypothetical protein
MEDSPMSTTFGTTYDNPDAEPANSAADAASTFIDPNDPMFTSESLEGSEKDAYARPAPPPEGHPYRVKLKLAPVEDPATKTKHDYIGKKDKNGNGYLVAQFVANIVDTSGPYDGITVFDQFGADTRKNRDGSTKVMSILTALRTPAGEKYFVKGEPHNAKEWMDIFVKALSGEPEVGIDLNWTWSCAGCGKEAKEARQAGKDAKYPYETVGMNKFPQVRGADGKLVYSPEMQCQVNKAHGFSRARIRIARFIPLSDLPKGI